MEDKNLILQGTIAEVKTQIDKLVSCYGKNAKISAVITSRNKLAIRLNSEWHLNGENGI